MGCTCEKVWRRKHSKVGHESESSSSTPPSMSDAQKAVIRNNWQTLKCHVANIGVITYVSMFESRPELLELFSKFKEQNINELRRAGLLRQHALRVMTTIDKVITRLDEPSSLIVMLREVGAHHKLYKVPPDYIQILYHKTASWFLYEGYRDVTVSVFNRRYTGNNRIILPHFLSAIKPHIEEHWCDDLETAWKTMFAIIIFHMSEGMTQPVHGHRQFIADPSS